MKVLQIACGMSYSKVYENLFTSLINQGVELEVYVPQHKTKSVPDLERNQFTFSLYSNKIIKGYDKLLYFTKIRRMVKDVENNFDLANISISHSHSLFSDGGVAYEIYKKYRIPYVVAVRYTDIYQYFKKAIHLRKYAINILKNASKVIFLSKPYRDTVIDVYTPNKLKNKILKKTMIIPNGVNDFWLNNKFCNHYTKENKEINLLFVGQITKRKNIDRVIDSKELLEKKLNKKVNLTVIGKRKSQEYFNRISNKGTFDYIPYIPKEEIIHYYRKSDIFVMPSVNETFGLVYAEAMSQGLPIIYTKGQGFDKQFNDGLVGYPVLSNDVDDITNKMILILNNYSTISYNCTKMVDKFSWDTISQEYIDIYKYSSI